MLADVEPISDRIVKAVFSGNPYLTVIVNYAPVEGSEEAEEHYETLSKVVNNIPKHNVIIECGDFNAHIVKDGGVYTFYETIISNGRFS